MPPKVIGPYRVLATLGSGGVGTVYRAVDRRSNEQVALKLLSTGAALDARAARRLAREFDTLAELSHPNVVKVFDSGVYQGYPYLAMELIEGLTLRHYLSLRSDEIGTPSGSFSRSITREEYFRDDDESSEEVTLGAGSPFNMSAFAEESPSEEYGSGPEQIRERARVADETDTIDSREFLSADVVTDNRTEPEAPPATSPNLVELNRPDRLGRLKDSMLQLCEALAYIHAHGLVHRDLKPSNIMVDEDRQVRLMDFGLAKFLADDAAVTQGGRLVGTFRYMAPEQILGEPLDARADLYSVGVILYELLSGLPPFDAKSPYALWQKVLETDPTPLLTLNRRTDPQLARVAHRLMRKEPGDRYQTAEEVFEALAE